MKSKMRKRKAGNQEISEFLKEGVKPARVLPHKEAESCPFCGAQPSLLHRDDHNYQVVCVNDSCHVRPITHEPRSSFKRAIKDWNRRRREQKTIIYG